MIGVAKNAAIKHAINLGWLSFLVFGGLLYLLNEFRVLRRHRHDEALTERPEGLEEYPVEIVIRINERTLGADRGVVYFDRSLIGFVGSSSSFLLAAEDFVLPKGPWLTDFDLPFRPLDLVAAGGKADIKVKPLIGYGRGYRKSLRRFLREQKPAHEPRQWPPLADFASQTAFDKEAVDPDKEAIEISSQNADLHILDQAERALERGDALAYCRLQESAYERPAP